MKALRAEFAKNSALIQCNQISFGVFVLFVAALLLFGYASYRYVKLNDQHATLVDEVQSARTKLRQLDNNGPKAPKQEVSEARSRLVSQSVAQLNLPWTDVFDSLEQATSSKIALLQITPDPKRKTVKLSGEAKSTEDIIFFIETLKKQVFFDSVILDKHELNEQDVNKPIRFQCEIHWRNMEVAP